MLPELSLHILDIAENSVRAKASLVSIIVKAFPSKDLLSIEIDDNGKGMTKEQLAQVTDPFFTTRTTRKIGLGVSFFKMAAENSGGHFTIESVPGKGTKVFASFGFSHIDRMPMGDLVRTIHTLVTMHPETDFIYQYTFEDHSFTMDTKEFREILGEVSFQEPEVSAFILSYIEENQRDTDQGALI
ncbi:MAG: ATP-binding protein [Lachnospiraceae bacterium]|nr:ATP-binding protein [Lachnospiraceae bacterium]